MGKRSKYLAAFVGALVAAAVWFWPEGPLWQTGPGVGRISGFSPNGSILVTSGFWRGDLPHVSRWHATTGKLLTRAEMTFDEPRDDREQRRVLPSADGIFALVGQGVPPSDQPGMAELWTGDWFLHDATTGERILGPIAGVNHIGLNPFSADNRWFVGYLGEPRSGVRHLDCPGIYATDTGKCIKELQNEKNREGYCAFAPNGDTVAVCWLPTAATGDKEPIVVEIIELPSGRTQRRVEFDPKSWRHIGGWDGRYLTTAASQPGDRRVIVFDFAQDAVGEGYTDPLLRDYQNAAGKTVHWLSPGGPDWVAHITHVAPGSRQSGIAGWLDQWLVHFGLRKDLSKHLRANVCMIDRSTGRSRYEFPRPLPLSVIPSADGKLLASGDDSIEVWDTDPPPRWPKAIAWGFIAAGTVILLGRWRWGRRQTPATARAQ